MFQFGIENLLSNKTYLHRLRGKRVALLGHPASVTKGLTHSLDLLRDVSEIQLSAALGPQHGMRGDKQDNMIESDDYIDPVIGIPVFSLYGEVRRPTSKMLDTFDVILVDLQDVGCRIYTYLTTLFYVLEACAKSRKEVWVLDRPNPAGRPVEGLYLKTEFESFVGAGRLPMRHGLTLGEAAAWYKHKKSLDVELTVVPMVDYFPDMEPGFGWPQQVLSWVNPSPNVPRLSAARMFAGTVLLEGTWLSEGRGTTTPLEVMGSPDIDGLKIKNHMEKQGSDWLSGCILRPCFFEPTFQKHQGKLCSGLQVHIDHPVYKHNEFRPFRLVSLFLRAVRQAYPDLDFWRQPPYEYEDSIMPVDMLSGSAELRNWVDDSSATLKDWDERLSGDEEHWRQQRQEFLLYK